MKRLILGLVPLLVGWQNPSAAATYFIDFVGGDDYAIGTSPSMPWKHGPGDPKALGRSGAAKLWPGDTVRFRGGVVYRGSIKASFDGSPGNPITYTGLGFGNGHAIFDGADAVTAITPCPSAKMCDDARDWEGLSVVTFRPPPTRFIKLYGAPNTVLVEAQTPQAKDGFFADDIADFATSPLADKAMIEKGRLRSPAMVRALAGRSKGSLVIWVYGTEIVRRPIVGIDGDYLLFVPDGIRLWPDRDGRYALLGDVNAISAPGQYVVTSPGVAIVRVPQGATLQVGNGRGGFELRGRQHLAIRGFVFRHQTAANYNEGVSISRTGPKGSGLLIDGNLFQDQALLDGKGVMTLAGIDGVIVTNNIISNIEHGSGVRAGGVNTSNILIAHNRFATLGRTGVAMLGVANSKIANNVFTNLRGIHGNGISLYLSNRRAEVVDNRIEATTRPMTFSGEANLRAVPNSNSVPPGNNDFLIERNIFVTPVPHSAALISWGANTRSVTIKNNVLIGPITGFLANGSDSGIVYTENYSSGYSVYREPDSDWTIARNRKAGPILQISKLRPRDVPALCKAAAVSVGQTLGGFAC